MAIDGSRNTDRIGGIGMKLRSGNTVTLNRPSDDRPRETTFIRWLGREERTPHYDCVVDLYGMNVLVLAKDLRPIGQEAMR
jgi:hypothetical protein